MAKKSPLQPRRRRPNERLIDFPGLFDEIEMTVDISRDDIAGSLVRRHRREQERHVALDPANQSIELDPARSGRGDRLRFISFGSGSSGNSAYLGTAAGGVLIDAGVDPANVYDALAANKIDIRTIHGILVTHDHSDHVKYAYTILRANRHMSLYATPRTLTGLLRRHNISNRIKDYHTAIYKEFPFRVGPFTVTAFETSHDGSDNMGFAITTGNENFVVTTDTGLITGRADHYMRQANYLMVESNYDLRMLMTGRYPEYLKARIVGQRGHMDNTETAAYLARLVPGVLSHIFLCHLSEDNNTPLIALDTTRRALTDAGVQVEDANTNPVGAGHGAIALAALPRFEASPLYILRHK